MKKILIFLLPTCVFFTGCNSCTQVTKNLESDWSNLERVVTITSAFTGDTLFHYDGPCYISESKNENGGTVIYYINGKAKKADFIGNGFNSVAIEK